MKKFITLALAVLLVFSMFTASAQTTEPIPAETSEQVAEKTSVSGIVSEVTDEYLMLGDDELQLNIDENTYICDYSLNPVEKVEKDAQVVAVVSTMTTMSLPAQNYAYFVFVNTDNSEAHPIYAVVDTNENGEIMSADGTNKIVYSDETPVIAHKIRIMLKGADITKGSEIVAFASTVGMSLPAHVPAEKIAVLSLAPVEEVVVEESAIADKTSISGTVSEIGEDYVVIGENEFRFNIDENTYICDYNMNPVEKIEKDAVITAVVSTMTTRSLPPQAYAYYIFVNTDNSIAAPIYAVVDTNENGEIMSADGNNRIVYSDETPVIAHKIRIMLRGGDITKGSEIVAFASTVGMSLPAHVPAEKIAVLSLAEAETAADETTFTVDGETFEFADAALFTEGSAPRFALRHVLETLGYTVNWNDSDWSIDIAGKTRNIVRIKIGEAMFEGQAEENFPVIVDSKTYVTEEIFKLLTSAK
ncbi:MAG: hypothetical protein IKW02_03015 [Clostridia bacterium]|nr:hypothetical protein [Clostridia bacterium]